MKDTLLLDQSAWDLVADARGNIAVASPPYAIAQDAASEVRLFEGEAYYETTRGIPYWAQVFGKRPPLALVRNHMARAAARVPGVIATRVFFTRFENRKLSGQVQVTDRTGKITVAAF